MRFALPPRAVVFCVALLLAIAFAVIQTLIGGTRLLFSLPALGLVAVAALLALLSRRDESPAPDRVCLWTSAIFFGYILLRALLSPAPYVARYDIFAVLGGLMIYAATATTLTSAKARLALVGFLLGCGVIHVCIGAIQFRDGNNFMPISFLQRADYGRRASGFYVCPNHLAGLLEVLGVFGLSIVCWSRWPVWGKLLVGYAAAVCYAGLLFSGSRGGWASAAASLLVFGILSSIVLQSAGRGLLFKVGAPALLLAALAISLTLFFTQKSDYLMRRVHSTAGDTGFRLNLWRAAAEQWKSSPITGTGSQTYIFYGRKFRTERMQLDPLHVHNDYLHLLCEYGIVGGAGFLIFFWGHLRHGWRNFQRLGPKRLAAVAPRLLSNGLAVNIACCSSIAAYVVHSAVDFNLHIPANVLLLAFVFGMLANGGTEHERKPSDLAVPIVRVGAALLGVVTLALGFRLLPAEYFAEKARTSLRDRQPVSAIYYARRAIEHDPRNPNLFSYLGRARGALAQATRDPAAKTSFQSAALEAFNAGYALVPLDISFSLEAALTYDALGRFGEAETMYAHARALDPRSETVLGLYKAHVNRRAARELHPSKADPGQPKRD